MKKQIGNTVVEYELSSSEIAAMQEAQAQAERSYWLNTAYDEAVHAEIRKRYTDSQEFAILRQRDEKPEEYSAYFAYCEQCKAYVKEMRAKYTGEATC